ncbi:MAG: type II toxin-antitoxin system PemK/MazF family toxin [Saprospiraceae bacterium]|nr:type II toxin-antitoxin system PemK/MazF family toxin [Saprospiraceae bacterium]
MFRGEVWSMSLDKKASGDESYSRHVVIVSSDALGALPLKVVVPLTPWKDEYSSAQWMVRVPPVLHSGLDAPMAADALQVRSVSSARLVKRLGELPDSFVEQICQSVTVVLEQ